MEKTEIQKQDENHQQFLKKMYEEPKKGKEPFVPENNKPLENYKYPKLEY